MYTQNYYSLFFLHNKHSTEWFTKNKLTSFAGHCARFSLVRVRTYAGSSPVTTDDASCFDASQLSINTTSSWFPSKAAGRSSWKLLQSSWLCDHERNIVRNHGDLCTKQIKSLLEQTALSHFCLKVVSKNVGPFFWAYGIYIFLFTVLHLCSKLYSFKFLNKFSSLLNFIFMCMNELEYEN